MVNNKLWRYVKLLSSDTGTDGPTDRETDGRTDGQTDKQTEGHICYINIARQCADAR